MRREDWTDRMFAAFEAHADSDFEYGASDCVLFAARVVDAMCDTDYESRVSALYSDERSAIRALRDLGGLEGAVRSMLGEPTALAYLQRGDVVLIENSGRDVLGIWDGQAIVAPGLHGLTRAPLSQARLTWAVR